MKRRIREKTVSLLKSEVARIILSIPTWLFIASCAWLSILVADSTLAAGNQIDVKAANFLFLLSFEFSLACTAVLVSFHLLLAILFRICAAVDLQYKAKLLGPLTPLLATLLIACAIGAVPFWNLALFLTSGEWISSRSWVHIARIFVFSGGLILTVLVLVWHLLLLHGTLSYLKDPPNPLGRFAASRREKAVLHVIGIALGICLFRACAYDLDNYALLAVFAVPFIWIAASTEIFAAVWSFDKIRPYASVISMAGVALLAILFVVPTVRGQRREQVGSAGVIADLIILGFFKASPSAVQFNVGDDRRFICRSQNPPKKLPPLSIPKDRRRNIILISLDALRADAVGKQVQNRPVTAELNRFSKEALYFEKAVSPYPATLFALGSALTGMNPSDILVSQQVPKNIFSLTKSRFDAQYIFLPQNVWFNQKIIDTLFVQEAELFKHKNASAQTTELIRKLEAGRVGNETVFAWIHYYEPHSPYKRHKDFDFGNSKKNRYYSEVSYADAEAGRLLEYLRKNDWMKNSLVVLFSDHGQALGERGYFGHHVHLTSWLTDVPIMVHAPETRGRKIRDRAGLIDLTPTILNFLDMDIPDGRSSYSLLAEAPRDSSRYLIAEAFPFRGKQLFAFAAGQFRGLEGLKRRLDMIQTTVKNYAPKVAIIHRAFRMIVDRKTGRQALYNDAKDPGNKKNIAKENEEKTKELETLLKQWHFEKSSQYYCDSLNSRAE